MEGGAGWPKGGAVPNSWERGDNSSEGGRRIVIIGVCGEDLAGHLESAFVGLGFS